MSVHNEPFQLEAEILDLRRLLATAGINAAEQEKARQLQRLVLEELHHRVKNILATVKAITTQSLRSALTVEEGRQAIENRLLALSRVHDLLLQTNWSKTKLAAVLAAAIDPYDTQGSGRFRLTTPDIDLSSSAVLPIAIVINELCTNAVKYGAMSTPLGHIEITSTISEDGRLFTLRWAEVNGPEVQPPTRRSFGSKLIEEVFMSRLHGKALLSFEPTGVVYQLQAPVAALLPLTDDIG